MLLKLRAYLLGTALLVAIIGGYFVIQHIKTIGRQELQIEKLEESIQIRNRIDAAVRNAPRDVAGSIRVLDDFLKSRQ
jgi:hypothetical protein